MSYKRCLQTVARIQFNRADGDSRFSTPSSPVFIVFRPFKLLRVTVSKRAVARADAPASRLFLSMDVYSRRGWSRENRRLCLTRFSLLPLLPTGVSTRHFLSDCFRAVIESMRRDRFSAARKNRFKRGNWGWSKLVTG